MRDLSEEHIAVLMFTAKGMHVFLKACLEKYDEFADYAAAIIELRQWGYLQGVPDWLELTDTGQALVDRLVAEARQA